jgi:WD40 repeat protein
LNRLILFHLILWLIIHPHPQPNSDVSDVPAQIMQLGHGTANTLDWHPTGNILAVGGQRGIWLYDELLADVAHFEDATEMTHLAWSPTGDLLATLDQDNTLRVWIVTLQPYIQILHQSWSFDNPDEYFRLYFTWSPDGEKLAVITPNGGQVLDVMTGEIMLNIADLDYVMAWHPDGTQLAGVVDIGEEIGKQVRVWDSTNGEIVNTYRSADPYLFWSDILWSPNGLILVGITSVPATLHAWSVETGHLLNDIDTSYSEFSAYLGMWWLNEGTHLVTLSGYVSPPSNPTLNTWDTKTWTTMDRGILLDDIWKIAKQPNADIWALLTSSGQITIRNLEKTEPLHIRTVHGRSPTILKWSADSRYLVAANRMNSSFYLWDVMIPDQPKSQVVGVPYQNWNLDELRWSADSNILIGMQSIPEITAPGAFSTAFIVEWDVQTGEFLRIIGETPGYIAHDGSGNYLPNYIWSNDFTRVAIEISDAPVTISTVATRENGFISPGETIVSSIDVVGYLSRTIWSPDNTLLAVISLDPQGETSAWVYDAETGNLVNRLRPTFFTTLYDISWSPDSTMVALVGSRGIAGSGETEYRLDVEAINQSSEEATHIITVLDTDSRFYHAWHPESRAIAVSTSLGVGIYPITPAPIGINAPPITTIPNTRVFALAWSPDCKWLAGGHEDGTVRVWDVIQVCD